MVEVRGDCYGAGYQTQRRTAHTNQTEREYFDVYRVAGVGVAAGQNRIARDVLGQDDGQVLAFRGWLGIKSKGSIDAEGRKSVPAPKPAKEKGKSQNPAGGSTSKQPSDGSLKSANQLPPIGASKLKRLPLPKKSSASRALASKLLLYTSVPVAITRVRPAHGGLAWFVNRFRVSVLLVPFWTSNPPPGESNVFPVRWSGNRSGCGNRSCCRCWSECRCWCISGYWS